MRKKLVSVLLVCVLCILPLMGCGADQKKGAEEDDGKREEQTTGKENEPTRVLLNEVAHSIFYAPMYVAMEKGYFKEQGIDLELKTGFGADKTMAAVLAGEADIGFMGPETTIYTYNEGLEDPVVNFAQLTQRAGNFLVAREETTAFSWEDLKGKTVLGGRKGGMPEMVFEYILKQHSMDSKKDLTIDQNIDFGSTAAAFAGGKGDYTVEFEPSATLLEQEKSGYVVASLGTDSGYVPYTAFSAKRSYLKEHADTVQAFVNALQRGMGYCANHTPAEIAEVIAPQFPDTDVKTIETIVTRYYDQDTWKTDLVFEKKSFELIQDIIEEAGELTDRAPYEKLVDSTFAGEAIE